MITHIRLSYDGDFQKYYKLVKYEARTKAERFYFITPARPTDNDIFLNCDLIIHAGAENPCRL
jgi:hypothetical protein